MQKEVRREEEGSSEARDERPHSRADSENSDSEKKKKKKGGTGGV